MMIYADDRFKWVFKDFLTNGCDKTKMICKHLGSQVQQARRKNSSKLNKTEDWDYYDSPSYALVMNMSVSLSLFMFFIFCRCFPWTWLQQIHSTCILFLVWYGLHDGLILLFSDLKKNYVLAYRFLFKSRSSLADWLKFNEKKKIKQNQNNFLRADEAQNIQKLQTRHCNREVEKRV